ncbi:hypothetical protein Mapa_005056 [Marchantia paleacea]|nr:hypothetical protein Mapa_005056 [Marchantia paleacea]
MKIALLNVADDGGSAILGRRGHSETKQLVPSVGHPNVGILESQVVIRIGEVETDAGPLDIGLKLPPDIPAIVQPLERAGIHSRVIHLLRHHSHQHRQRSGLHNRQSRPTVQKHSAPAPADGKPVLGDVDRHTVHGDAFQPHVVEGGIILVADQGSVLQPRDIEHRGLGSEVHGAGLGSGAIGIDQAVGEHIAVNGADLGGEGNAALREPHQPIAALEQRRGAEALARAAEGEVGDSGHVAVELLEIQSVGHEVARGVGEIGVEVGVAAAHSSQVVVRRRIAAGDPLVVVLSAERLAVGVGAGEERVGGGIQRQVRRVHLLEAVLAREALQPGQIAAGVDHGHEILRRRAHRDAHHVLARRRVHSSLEFLRQRSPLRPAAESQLPSGVQLLCPQSAELDIALRSLAVRQPLRQSSFVIPVHELGPDPSRRPEGVRCTAPVTQQLPPSIREPRRRGGEFRRGMHRRSDRPRRRQQRGEHHDRLEDEQERSGRAAHAFFTPKSTPDLLSASRNQPPEAPGVYCLTFSYSPASCLRCCSGWQLDPAPGTSSIVPPSPGPNLGWNLSLEISYHRVR